MSSVSQFQRFEAVRRLFQTCCADSRADEPLLNWTVPSDRHLPSVLIELTLRQVLDTPYSALETTRGVGPTKLDRLLAIVERAVISLQQDASGFPASSSLADVSIFPVESSASEKPPSPSPPAAPTPDAIGEGQWQILARRIRAHGLDHYPVGRFARSLLELPRSLWNEPFSSFTSRSLAQIRRLSG